MIHTRNLPFLTTLAVFLVAYVLCVMQYPAMFSTRVVGNLLTDNAFLGIAAVGMTFVILSGGIDLSIGSVIAFARQSRLPLGHVAVVSRIVEDRVLMLTHANWSRIDGTRGHAEQDVTVFDVSEANDWSRVKVWYRDSNGLGGTIYTVHGFIYAPGRPHEHLTAQNPDYVGALIDAYVPGAGAGSSAHASR